MQLLHQQNECAIAAVTEANVNQLLALSLADEQQGFIETISACLQEAKADQRFVPVALYFQQNLVGFAMFGEFYEPNQRVWFDRFLIDKAFQGLGLGKAFAELIVGYLCQYYAVTQVFLSVYQDNPHAIKLYQQLGFSFTGEVDQNGELIMRWQQPE